jgi:hypothetical protein
MMAGYGFCFGQTTFERTYGTFSNYEYGYDVVQLTDTSYLMVGQASTTYDSLRILKFSSAGNLIWDHGVDRVTQHYLFKLNENSFYVTQTGDIRKIDSLGNSIWFTSYWANELNARLNPTYDSGYVCTGALLNYHAFGILKYDSSAMLLRSDTIKPDTIYKYWILGIKELSDYNYLVASEKNQDTIVKGYEFFKVDTSANIVWRKNISRDSIIIRDMIPLSDTGFAIIGVRPFDNFRLFLKRFDSNGNLTGNYLYVNTYTANNRLHVQQTSDMAFIIGGEIGFGGTDLLVLKADSSGYQQWYRTFGSTNFDYFGSVSQTLDRGYVVCGTKYVVGNNMDYYLIKTDSMGAIDSTVTSAFNSHIDNTKIKIYPNPACHRFTIKNISSKEKIFVEIINVFGEIVYSEILLANNDYQVDANLAKGIYIVNVRDGARIIVSKLVVD